MRIALRYLWILGIFGLGLGTLYWFLSDEVVGAVALWFFGVMPLIVATWWTLRGTDAAVSASDDPDASPQDRTGHVVGSFPLMTAWPVFLAMGVIVIGASLVYGLILLPVGAALLVWALIGLARETPD
jgi:Cytochrome c oxidase subunit IV